MKAKIVYSTEFIIPKILPHAELASAGNEEIFGDSVDYSNMGITLKSNHGETHFWNYRVEQDYFVIPADTMATYKGARRALNAVWGIEFPECVVTNVESTIGRFETLEDYDRARTLSLPVMKYVERFLKEKHSSDVETSTLAIVRIVSLERALSRVIDMDDPCRNPIP